tara:strand:+ start:107 stop:1177 length:1071 start_codon:yes stop_codon:yes gene_type:complete
MAILQSTNVQGTLCVNGTAVGGSKNFKYCCMSSSTTFTPSQDLVDGDKILEALVVAGGGGGGGTAIQLCYCGGNSPSRSATQFASGSTGGGGQVIRKSATITATTGCTVTVGAGGIGGYIQSWNSPAVGDAVQYAPGSGGNSQFGTNIIGRGGSAGGNCFRCVRACCGVFESAVTWTSGAGTYPGKTSVFAGVTTPLDGRTPLSGLANSEAIYNCITSSTNDSPVYVANCTDCYVNNNLEPMGGLQTDTAFGGYVPDWVTSSVDGAADRPNVFSSRTYGCAQDSVCTGKICCCGMGINWTASAPNDRFFGIGGVGATACATACNYGSPAVCLVPQLCAQGRGAKGTGGIVILKWSE